MSLIDTVREWVAMESWDHLTAGDMEWFMEQSMTELSGDEHTECLYFYQMLMNYADTVIPTWNSIKNSITNNLVDGDLNEDTDTNTDRYEEKEANYEHLELTSGKGKLHKKHPAAVMTSSTGCKRAYKISKKLYSKRIAASASIGRNAE